MCLDVFSGMHNTFSQPWHHLTEINENYFVLDMGTHDVRGKTGHSPSRSVQPPKGEGEVIKYSTVRASIEHHGSLGTANLLVWPGLRLNMKRNKATYEAV